MQTSKNIIPISEINGIGTLQATFASLFHALMTGYSIGDK